MKNVKVYFDGEEVHSGTFLDERFIDVMAEQTKGLFKKVRSTGQSKDMEEMEIVLYALHTACLDDYKQAVSACLAWLLKQDSTITEVHYNLSDDNEMTTEIKIAA